MVQSVYDYVTGLLGIDEDEQRRRSLERAVARAPLDLQRNYQTIDAAMASRTPARAGMYPEIDATLGGLRPREISAMSDMEAEIGRRAAGFSEDIPSVMQLTPNEIRAIGAQGAVRSVLDPSSYSRFVEESPDDTVLARAGKKALGAVGNLGGAFPLAARGTEDFIRYAMSSADDPYELEGVRVARQSEEAAKAREAALAPSNKAAAVAKKILEGTKAEDLTEEELEVAGNLVKDAPATAAKPTAAAQEAASQAGLLAPQPQSKFGGLLGTIAQNLQDALIAQGTLEAGMPQLVTAKDLDKIRTITPQMVMAQSQKIKQATQQRESQAARDAVSALKDQLAIQRDLKALSAEGNKKLEREAESIIKARDTIGFIEEALPLISRASTGNVFAQGTQFLAGTPAYALEAALKPIRARIGFDELTRMRLMSPTGGALGQVSNFENQLLQATKGSLEIGTPIETMRRNLLNYRDAQMAMIHGIVDNQGRLRRLESQGDLDELRAGRFRVARESDAGSSLQSNSIMNYNRQTGAFE